MKLAISLALARRPFQRGPSPLGALVKGLVAGAVGAFLQNQFYKLTERAGLKPDGRRVGPEEGGKPEPEQEDTFESAANRFAAAADRGPLAGDAKKAGGAAVHYLFGAAWGALYGLSRETWPKMPALLFSTVVWAVSDNLLLPLMRLGAWPHKYTVKEHAYALNAHFVFGLGTSSAYSLLRDVGISPLAALPALLALRSKLWFNKTAPGKIAAARAPVVQRFFWQAADKAFAH